MTLRDEVRDELAQCWDEAYEAKDVDEVLDYYTDRIIKLFVGWTREAGIG